MLDEHPLTMEDRNFLHNLAVHLRKRVASPIAGREGVLFPTGDCDKIADKLERLAAEGDSGAEISRVVV